MFVCRGMLWVVCRKSELHVSADWKTVTFLGIKGEQFDKLLIWTGEVMERKALTQMRRGRDKEDSVDEREGEATTAPSGLQSILPSGRKVFEDQ